MATAGYLISRAAEQPAILVAEDRDRRRALLRARPPARPLPRAARLPRPRPSRSRPRARARLRADRAAGAGAARGLPAGRPAVADGRRRRRAPEPPSARRRPAARRRCWPARLASASRRPSCPPAALVLAVGLLAGGVAVPAARRRPRPPSRPPPGAARGELSAELVELLRRRARARRLRRAKAPRWRACAPPTGAGAVARRDALAGGVADGLGLLVTGVTVPACSPSRSGRTLPASSIAC